MYVLAVRHHAVLTVNVAKSMVSPYAVVYHNISGTHPRADPNAFTVRIVNWKKLAEITIVWIHVRVVVVSKLIVK